MPDLGMPFEQVVERVSRLEDAHQSVPRSPGILTWSGGRRFKVVTEATEYLTCYMYDDEGTAGSVAMKVAKPWALRTKTGYFAANDQIVAAVIEGGTGVAAVDAELALGCLSQPLASSGNASAFVAVVFTTGVGDLTCDGVFHDLDLADYSGDAANAVAAIMQPFSVPTADVDLRYPDPPPGTAPITLRSPVFPPAVVPCDAGVLQYCTSAAALQLTCSGYWKPAS